MVNLNRQQADPSKVPVSVLAGLQQRCHRLWGEGLLGFFRRLPGCGDLLRWRGNVGVPQTIPKSVRQNLILPELQDCKLEDGAIWMRGIFQEDDI